MFTINTTVRAMFELYPQLLVFSINWNAFSLLFPADIFLQESTRLKRVAFSHILFIDGPLNAISYRYESAGGTYESSYFMDRA